MMELEASHEQLQKLEFMRREQRQRLEDLAAVLKRPEGQRLLLDILRRLGMGEQTGAETLVLRNFGLALMREMLAANPPAATAIMARLLGGE